VGMGGIRELLDGKIWEWDLSFRWEWEWDGNGNEVVAMGGNWYEKSSRTPLAHIHEDARDTDFREVQLPFCDNVTLMQAS